jgi:hypothetical protein
VLKTSELIVFSGELIVKTMERLFRFGSALGCLTHRASSHDCEVEAQRDNSTFWASTQPR